MLTDFGHELNLGRMRFGAFKALALVIGLGVATPAVAQDFSHYDPADIETCLQQSTADPYQCIGVGAEVCYGRSSGSNFDYGFCNAAERDDWDARLNATYQDMLISQAEATDSIQEFQPDAPDLVDQMRDMQRAWISYRDAACDWEFSQWGGGSGGPPAYAACQGRLTAQQTVFLQQWLPR